jgi:hypothetical protein
MEDQGKEVWPYDIELFAIYIYIYIKDGITILGQRFKQNRN